MDKDEKDDLEPEMPPCPTCMGAGVILVGWDEEGRDIMEDCHECGGDPS